MRVQTARRSISRTSSGDVVAIPRKRFFVLIRLDNDRMDSLSRMQFIPMELRWARSAIEANSARHKTYPLVHTSMYGTPNPHAASLNFWNPFLKPSPSHVELFVYETETEDMTSRSGSGRTAISASLFFPTATLDELASKVRAYTPKFEFKKVWCLEFASDRFRFPPTRTVPAHRPILDCWVKRLSATSLELTLNRTCRP